MKVLNNRLCMEHGFSICELGKKKSFDGRDRKGLVSDSMDKYQFLKKAKEGKVKSFVQDTAIAVYDAMQDSYSKEDFIQCMEQKGYCVDWQENRKYIVFINSDGNKVRDRNLQKTYNLKAGKEELIQFFKEKSLSRRGAHPPRHRGR